MSTSTVINSELSLPMFPFSHSYIDRHDDTLCSGMSRKFPLRLEFRKLFYSFSHYWEIFHFELKKSVFEFCGETSISSPQCGMVINFCETDCSLRFRSVICDIQIVCEAPLLAVNCTPPNWITRVRKEVCACTCIGECLQII